MIPLLLVVGSWCFLSGFALGARWMKKYSESALARTSPPGSGVPILGFLILGIGLVWLAADLLW